MTKLKKTSLAQLLLQRGLVLELKTAEAVILAGKVVVDEQRIDKPGALVPSHAQVRLKQAQRFVSRAGEKLAAALEHFGVAPDICGKVVLDVGASTGGFTDCLIQLGAGRVLCVDTGTNQLAYRLRQHPQVEVWEQTDIRVFSPPSAVDWVTVDVSFIGLRQILPQLWQNLSNEGSTPNLLLLVKPQFELPSAMVPPGGVVTCSTAHKQATAAVAELLESFGVTASAPFAVPTKGRKGNQEFFMIARGAVSKSHDRGSGR